MKLGATLSSRARRAPIHAWSPAVGEGAVELVEPGLAEIPSRVSDLTIPWPAFSRARTCAEVLAYFTSHPDRDLLPIVDDERPLGLIARNAFVERFSRPFHHELFDNKSCKVFMDRNPLVAEHEEALVDLGARAAATSHHAASGFIVTRQGRYAGIGTGQALMRALADIQLARSRQIMESVRYASRIQRALLSTSDEQLARWLPQHRLFWEPRDVVGGDYYFCRGNEDRVLLVVLDCTGHGVPGALMTMIMTSGLEAAATEIPSLHPGRILASVHRRVRRAMGQHTTPPGANDSAPAPDDGMDAAAVLIDRAENRLLFSGARLPMFLCSPNAADWTCLPSERMGIGYAETPDTAEWPVCEQPLEAGLRIALATDGLFDQIGECKRIAYGKKRFTQSLASNGRSTLEARFESALADYRSWQGTQLRRDDATLIMVEV